MGKSSVRLNRDVLINGIVRHQGTFFKLIDYIDNNDGTLEFPEHLYINLYNTEICKDDDFNTHIQLSMQSLLENGIFIHNDKNTGMVTVERVIVDLLRFIDIKRSKELNHFDFEHLRRRAVDITDEIKSLPLESQEQIDAAFSFNNLMSEIHSKVIENVSSLTAQVESIAHDYKIYDAGNSTVTVDGLYERVTNLYTRYVLPCYEFINPNMEMKGTKSFTKSIQELINYYSSEELKLYKTANALQYRKTAITSYFKNISTLVRKLEQFSIHLERDRDYYLAIESAYSELMDNIIPLRHGKQRNKYLTPKAQIFSNYYSLDGLCNRKSKYSTRLNWNNESVSLRFKEYLYIINETLIKKKRLKPLPPRSNISQDRQIKISKILNSVKSPGSLSDIHRFIYDVLKEKLDKFSLLDVLYGLEAYIPMQNQERVVSTFLREIMTDDKYFFNYLALELKEEKVDV